MLVQYAIYCMVLRLYGDNPLTKARELSSRTCLLYTCWTTLFSMNCNNFHITSFLWFLFCYCLGTVMFIAETMGNVTLEFLHMKLYQRKGTEPCITGVRILLTLCMLGNCSCFCCRLLTFFKINFFIMVNAMAHTAFNLHTKHTGLQKAGATKPSSTMVCTWLSALYVRTALLHLCLFCKVGHPNVLNMSKRLCRRVHLGWFVQLAFEVMSLSMLLFEVVPQVLEPQSINGKIYPW